VNVYLIRHAEAESRSSSGRDADRSLTPDGREAARTAARALARAARIERILHSPLLRARETAGAIREMFPDAEVSETEALRPESDPEETIAEIGAGDGGAVAVVGHQPNLGRVLGYLLTGRPDTEIPIGKTAVVRLSVEGDRVQPPARLKWLFSPKLAARLMRS